MTYSEWLVFVAKVQMQHTEGAITAFEAFNAIVGRAAEVEQTETDPEGPFNS